MEYNNEIHFAEVSFYFLAKVHGIQSALAVVTLYSLPDSRLLEASSGAVVSCVLTSVHAVVPVKAILAVIAMIPHSVNNRNRQFVVEKPGLDISILAGASEPVSEE